MKVFTTTHQSITTASIFGVVGFALMTAVIIFHAHINNHSTLAQADTAVNILSVDAPNPVPDELIQSIVSDPRNVMDVSKAKPATPLPPAMQFLRDLSAQDLFITQD